MSYPTLKTLAFKFKNFIPLLLILSGILLFIPKIQLSLVHLGETVLGRSLNNIDLWISRLVSYAILLICLGLLTGWLHLRSTEKYQYYYQKNKEMNNLIICISIIVLSFILFILPFIIFGEDSVITIHDNLEDSIPRFHYIHLHNLFWTFNKKLPVLDNISTLFFNREGFSIYNAIYCYLPGYIGYTVNYIFCTTLGFISMFFLQKMLFKNPNIIINTITSLAYAFLPAICVYRMAVATLPFAVILFFKLYTTNEKKWLCFAFIYPFFSELSSVGLFVCGFWFISTIIVTLKNRFNWRLIFGLLLIVIAFCITNSRMLYMRLVLNEPLNRDYFSIPPSPFIKSFNEFFFNGFYHAATLQTRLLNWVVFYAIIVIIYKTIKREELTGKYKRILFICLSLVVLCATISALSEAKIIGIIVERICPPLKGVSFTKIFTISRLLWYIAFTASLLYLASHKRLKGISYSLGFLQLIIIFVIPQQYYSDSIETWRKNIFGGHEITWKEFYSEKQFNNIKDDISYKDEKICAVGFHPGILLYNNFNTIDGYISVYPYKDQLKWHDLLKTEFDKNLDDMRYFDSWGGRRYIYNSELRYYPTKEKFNTSVKLNINMKLLKDYYNCKYIFSRAELSNADELGLKYKGTNNYSESIYTIWVYEIENN